MNKIVIIGANSYIARNMIFYISQVYTNTQLKLYDRCDRQVDNLGEYSPVNVLDSESVSKIDFDCDLIYVFVGKTGTAIGFDEYNSFIDVNEKALLNIINEYRRQGSKAKIIFPSTRLVYKGKSGLIKEDAEKEFKTIYSINKYACEQYLEQYHRVFDVQYCIVRICVPYGSLIPNASSYGTAEFMLSKAKSGESITLFGDGSARRTVTFIGDLCEALLKCGFSEKCSNDVFNIGGEDYSLKEMAELIATRYNVGIEFAPWPKVASKIESGNTVFDDSKLQNACKINYRTKFSEWCNT